MATTHSVIVIGAGISGLVCAYALKKSGKDVLLLESSEKPGGVIQTLSENGALFETGPQSFSTTPMLTTLIDDLKLSDQLVVAPPKAPRYILVNGQLQAVPLSPSALLISSLLSWTTKLSLLREPFRKTIPPSDDESVAEFVRRKFTPELLELLVGPFVSGIYAGDPERLSLQAAFPQLHEAEERAGSVIQGMKAAAKAKPGPHQKPVLASFREGNATLPRTLSQVLADSFQQNVRVTKLNRDASGEYAVEVANPSGPVQFRTRHLVLATPTRVAAALLESFLPAGAAILAQMEYAPVAVVSLGYRRADVSHSMNGFGFLVPRSAGLRVLGTVWNSSLFPNRAPQGQILLTSFLGGTTDPSAAALPTSEIVALAHKELSPILGLKAQPVTSHATAYEFAIPQYAIGHAHRIAALRRVLANLPGLHLVGNYLNGPAIGACVEQAQAVAESIRIG